MSEEIDLPEYEDFRTSVRIRKEWIQAIDQAIIDNPDLFRNRSDIARRGLVLVLKELKVLK